MTLTVMRCSAAVDFVYKASEYSGCAFGICGMDDTAVVTTTTVPSTTIAPTTAAAVTTTVVPTTTAFAGSAG